MRNQLCRKAAFDHLVIADDDMLFIWTSTWDSNVLAKNMMSFACGC